MLQVLKALEQKQNEGRGNCREQISRRLEHKDALNECAEAHFQGPVQGPPTRRGTERLGHQDVPA